MLQVFKFNNLTISNKSITTTLVACFLMLILAFKTSAQTPTISVSIDSITPNGSGFNVTTGDVINYQISVSLPQGTTENLVITDVLPAGFDFQKAVLDTTGFMGSVSLSSFARDMNINSGETVTMTLGAMTTVTGITNNSFVINLTARVNDHIANDGLPAVQNKTNTATLIYTGFMEVIQDTASIDFAEPELTITKTMSPDSELQANDTVTVTLEITNTGTAPAYEVNATDLINNDGLLFDLVTIATGSAGCSYTNPTFSCNFVSMTSGASETVSFIGTVRDDVLTGSSFDNIATVAGSSQFGTINQERLTNDSSTDTVSTMTVTTSKSLIASSESWTSDTDPIEAAIGEILTFQLAFVIPEGLTQQTVNNNLISDTLPSGHRYMANTSTIRAEIDTTLTSVTLAGTIPTTATALEPTINGQNIEFDLGNIDNNDDDANLERLIIEYDVLVLNTADNNRTNIKTNTASFNYLNADNNPQGITDLTSWTISEPNLTISKTAAPATVSGGDSVTFTVILTNENSTNVTRAWDPIITDNLPSQFNNPTIISATHSSQGDISACAGFTGNLLTLDSFCLAAIDRYLASGDTITLIYTAAIDSSIGFEQQITNTAIATTSSLPGSNGTGSEAPGMPGETDGERNGSGANENDLSATNDATVTVGKPTITKSGNANLQILETTIMTIQVDIPVGTTDTFVITDDLPPGLSYTGQAIVINPPAMNFSSSMAPNLTPGAGTDPLIFDFGTITNSAASAQTININYQVQVNNILTNQNSTSLANTATLTYTGVTMPFPSDSATITVVEPNLEVNKSITAGASGSDAGDSIEYTITVTNTAATATAYRVELKDVLPEHLLQSNPSFSITSIDDDGGQVIENGGGVVTTGDAVISTTTNTDDTLSWPLLDIPAGATFTFVYEAVLTNNAVAGEMLTNTVTANYDSLEAGGGRDSTDSSNDDDGNLDNYGDSDSVTLTVNSMIAIQKSLNASHANNDFSIGDLVTFDIRVDVIEGIKGNVEVTDVLPAGLTFEGPIRIVANPNISYSGAGNAVESPINTLTIDLDNITNNFDANSANDFLILEVDARVIDTVTNTNGSNLTNSVSLTADVGPAGPDTQVVDLIEPNLIVTKAVDNSSPDLGDEVTYTITVSHNSSTADAYDVVLTDIIPAGLSYVALSHSGDGSVNESNPSIPTFDLGTITLAEISKTFSFKCLVEDNALVGTPINNIISASYDSQAGSPSIERTYSSAGNINITAHAYIGVAQESTINGTQITFDFYLENFDNINLNSLSLPFDLDSLLGENNYTILLGPSFIDDPGTIILNPGFDGSADTALITSGTFNPFETAQIKVVLVIDNVINLMNGIGSYISQVNFSAQSSNGFILLDLSDDGQDPDPNGNTNPTEIGENDPSAFLVDSSLPIDLINYSIE